MTFGHVIHILVQHIVTEGGSEQEGNLSFKFYSIKVCNICYLASIFIEQNSTQDCFFFLFIKTRRPWLTRAVNNLFITRIINKLN